MTVTVGGAGTTGADVGVADGIDAGAGTGVGVATAVECASAGDDAIAASLSGGAALAVPGRLAARGHDTVHPQ